MIIKMINELWRGMDKYRKKFNKVLENRKKNETEMNNIITEIKNIL